MLISDLRLGCVFTCNITGDANRAVLTVVVWRRRVVGVWTERDDTIRRWETGFCDLNFAGLANIGERAFRLSGFDFGVETFKELSEHNGKRGRGVCKC